MESEFCAENDEPNKIVTSCVKSPKKIAPIVPPKPYKKKKDFSEIVSDCGNEQNDSSRLPTIQRKYPTYSLHRSLDTNATLDNSLVLEQKLEALAHHKRQLEKNDHILKERKNNEKYDYRISSPHSVDGNPTNVIPANLRSTPTQLNVFTSSRPKNSQNLNTNYSIGSNADRSDTKGSVGAENSLSFTEKANSTAVSTRNDIYSNIFFDGKGQYESPPLSVGSIDNTFEYCSSNNDEETPPPPSPVSSSYSELRRATDVFLKNYYHSSYSKANETEGGCDNAVSTKGLNNSQQAFVDMSHSNEFNSYCPTQGSSPYESIYEPITPRPPSNISAHGIYSNYASYVNRSNLNTNGSAGNISTIGSNNTSRCNTPSYPSLETGSCKGNSKSSCQEIEVEALTDYLVHSLDTGNGEENYGTCFKCNQRVLGENSGCTAMEKIYHIVCFTCTECQVNLQGKPFYALDGKPFCEYDYVQTLEKCSVCTKPILERILRATGKPYHPQCFTCVICGKSLDGVPFTVDATNQNYCISDFHKKFAPRCCVCKEPIMPELGEEETVRVVALDRSFHFECYKCEDCGLLLSSEVEGRGCYPLDGHVLCMSCNAKRVQMLTSRMAAE
ncbi:lipoma-preferred partner isoform X2 [Eurosta solidaginis]|uniref:lipoma-preferred partner isoform X2 n=1 Tax=Eurosta solidaginis TaxID=178769 RepID=UPI0035314F6D